MTNCSYSSTVSAISSCIPMEIQRNNILRDIGIVFLSTLVALVLIKTGAIQNLLGATRAAGVVGSFIAGIFFVSIFTSVPATVALAELSLNHSLVLIALFGGLGALVGDAAIFRFVRGSVLTDVLHRSFENPEPGWFMRLFRHATFNWIIKVAGALIVASPFPDEIGLAMMGLTKMRTRVFIPLSFSLNFFGILVVGLIARAM